MMVQDIRDGVYRDLQGEALKMRQGFVSAILE